MKRSQLRADFEQSFPAYDKRRMVRPTNPPKFCGYVDQTTQLAWQTWVSAFETYSNDSLTGEYDDPS